MRSLFKVVVVAVLGLAVIHTAPASAIAAPQSAQSPTDKAFEAAKNKAWSKAAKHASQTNDPLTVKIIEWLRYQKT
ncbi:MAG: hypothetical protein ACI8S3_001847, partial [Alphaproteobacteria bacterium]